MRNPRHMARIAGLFQALEGTASSQGQEFIRAKLIVSGTCGGSDLWVASRVGVVVILITPETDSGCSRYSIKSGQRCRVRTL
jgi:hypothetical protein